jgi:hypothetical protein
VGACCAAFTSWRAFLTRRRVAASRRMAARSIMEGLFYTHKPMLNSVHPLEQQVSEMRDTLLAAVEHSLVALQEYLTQYDQVCPAARHVPFSSGCSFSTQPQMAQKTGF